MATSIRPTSVVTGDDEVHFVEAAEAAERNAHTLEFVEPDNKAAVRYLAVDALNISRTLNYNEKNGFAYLFKDEELEAVSTRMKFPLKKRYMYFDLIKVIRK